MSSPVEQVWEKLSLWWDGLWIMLPNLGVALLVMAAFYGIARLVQKGVRKLLKRTKVSRTAIPVLSRTTALVVGILGLMIALNVLHLEDAAASLLAGAGILGLAVGLAFQDIASNYFAGFILSLKSDTFEVGDIIETNDVMGTVEAIDLRTTRIRTFQGQEVVVPNRKVFEVALTNYSTKMGRRVDVEVGCSYADDLEQVTQVTKRALESLSTRDQARDPEVFFTGFGGSSIDLVGRFWLKPFLRQSQFFEARHEAILAIKKAYDEAEITIPFPIRTLDFGIEGGERLSEMFPPEFSQVTERSSHGAAASPSSGAGSAESQRAPARAANTNGSGARRH